MSGRYASYWNAFLFVVAQMFVTKVFVVIKVFVVADKKYETIILPIFGVPAPFHISTIKVRITSLWISSGSHSYWKTWRKKLSQSQGNISDSKVCKHWKCKLRKMWRPSINRKVWEFLKCMETLCRFLTRCLHNVIAFMEQQLLTQSQHVFGVEEISWFWKAL